MGQALPGFETPAVGFDLPYEMLAACHERLQRSLSLLARLAEHIEHQGHGSQTCSAAADVLRYFDLAAPLHHQDEERHVFPPLRAEGDAALTALVEQLQAEHRQMEAQWALLRQPLLRWSEPGCKDAVTPATHAAIAGFVALYARHLQAEENQVFTKARSRMSAAAQEAMGREMQARRQG